MDLKSRTKQTVHRNHTIIQEVKWVNNPMDGDGYELRTTINELPKYSDFDQFAWLSTDKQKQKVIDAEKKAMYHIDTKLKEKEPDLFDELGFK